MRKNLLTYPRAMKKNYDYFETPNICVWSTKYYAESLDPEFSKGNAANNLVP